MEGSGEPRATGLQPSHAAPTELGSAGRPLRYKYAAPTGACTGPREDPCKEQGKRSARPLWLGQRLVFPVAASLCRRTKSSSEYIALTGRQVLYN